MIEYEEGRICAKCNVLKYKFRLETVCSDCKREYDNEYARNHRKDRITANLRWQKKHNIVLTRCKETHQAANKKLETKYRETLADRYVVKTLNVKNPTKELIELKRTQILLNREIRNGNNQHN